MSVVLAAEGLAVGYAGRHGRLVLEGLGLGLRAGRLTCLLGPNGSGKSTLLRTLAGMQPALAGRVELLGDDVTRIAALERARRLAVVLTDQVDVGIMRAADVVALGRYPHTGWDGRLGERDQAAVRWALAATGAGELAERNMAELSDGERQRVLIARALAQEPAVLALDEPIAFVDIPRRVELTHLLRDLARECGLAVLLTTHDIDLALRSADELWVLEPATGRLHAGAPEDLVLAGAIGRAFQSREVRFDTLSGRFVPRPAPLGRVRVLGESAAATWAARAMEREGLDPGGGPGELVVRVHGDVSWELTSPAGTVEGRTIGALVEQVRALLPGLGHGGRRARMTVPAPSARDRARAERA